MARPLFKDSTKSGLTLFLALAAFLMGLYTISDNLIVFFKLQEWKVAD
ncbi:hypothetical protein [Acinetobacter baumannii]|nr:hypothetical protein [Acinetobacter baumannii]